MSAAEAESKADGELQRQLREAGEDEPVEAVFVLHRPDRDALPPDVVQGLADRLIDEVQTETGSAVHDRNVFRHMGSFVVAAKPAVIRRLLERPEVASALANRRPGRTDGPS